jgi:hypothetical protein
MELTPLHPSSASSPEDASGQRRCQHISRNGRPCRYLALSGNTLFCRAHQPAPSPGSPEALAELAGALQKAAHNFDSPERVKDVLFMIFRALLEGHITERKASILCYLAQTILHSHRAMTLQRKLDAEAAAQRAAAEQAAMRPDKLTWNLPR